MPTAPRFALYAAALLPALLALGAPTCVLVTRESLPPASDAAAMDRIRRGPTDYAFDSLCSIAIDPPADMRIAEVLTYDQRALWEHALTTHDAEALASVEPSARALDPVAPTTGPFEIEQGSYGRKVLECRLEPIDGARAPALFKSTPFVHEGLGGGRHAADARPLESRSVLVTGSDGAPLPQVDVLVIAASFVESGRRTTDPHGRVDLPAGRVGVGISTGAGLVWSIQDGGSPPAPVRLASTGVDLHGVEPGDAVGAWLIQDDERRLPIPARIEGPDRVVLHHAAGAHAALVLHVAADGALRAHEVDLDVAASGGDRVSARPREARFLERREGDEVAVGVLRRVGHAPRALFEHPLEMFLESLESPPSIGGSPVGLAGEDWVHYTAFLREGRIERCVESSGPESWSTAESLRLKTVRGHDLAYVFDEGGALLATTWTGRYGEGSTFATSAERCFAGGRSWDGASTILVGATPYTGSTVWISDTAERADEGTRRSSAAGFVNSHVPSDPCPVQLIAQFYPGPDRFGHRFATSNAHGFFRVTGLPDDAVVDLIARDFGVDEGGVYNAVFPYSKRFRTGRGEDVRVDLDLEPNRIYLHLPRARAGCTVEVHRLRESGGADPPAPVLTRSLPSGCSRMVVHGVPAGQFRVLVKDGEQLVERFEVEAAL